VNECNFDLLKTIYYYIRVLKASTMLNISNSFSCDLLKY
jgi:hypothetical protein